MTPTAAQLARQLNAAARVTDKAVLRLTASGLSRWMPDSASAGEAASGFSSPETALSSQKTARFGRMLHRIGRIQQFVRKLQRYDVLEMEFGSRGSFRRDVAPALLLGRFFGKHIIVNYRRNQAEIDFARSGWWIVPFLRLCDRILVPTQYQADLLACHGVDAEVAAQSVDTDLFRRREIASVQPRMLVVRSLEQRNNVACVIEAFGIVKQKYPRAQLTIAGDGPERNSLEELAAGERGNGITFVGEAGTAELARLMADADLYVNASSIDGLPYSLVAAIAVGLPVVTTDAGGIAELIHEEQNGLIFGSEDPAGLADRIIRLVESPELVRRLNRQS